jgi:hypothetical protein
MSPPKARKPEPVKIMITRSESDLILRYGYPFEDIQRQLESARDLDLRPVTDSSFWWEQVIVNLHISEKENFDDEELLEDLRALIERIAEHLGLL